MIALLKTLLGMEGYVTASLFEKKGDPIENIRRENPDILILDVHLGDHNGLEIVRQVRAEDDLKHIRVIMASGMDRAEQCLGAGADIFLLKPYMPEELLKKLRAL